MQHTSGLMDWLDWKTGSIIEYLKRKEKGRDNDLSLQK